MSEKWNRQRSEYQEFEEIQNENFELHPLDQKTLNMDPQACLWIESSRSININDDKLHFHFHWHPTHLLHSFCDEYRQQSHSVITDTSMYHFLQKHGGF
jgi:hypothetical protein